MYQKGKVYANCLDECIWWFSVCFFVAFSWESLLTACILTWSLWYYHHSSPNIHSRSFYSKICCYTTFKQMQTIMDDSFQAILASAFARRDYHKVITSASRVLQVFQLVTLHIILLAIHFLVHLWVESFFHAAWPDSRASSLSPPF